MIDADDYLARAKDLRDYADSIGMPCNQTHAPFASALKGNEEYNKDMYPRLLRAIEISGVLGAKACIVHPCNDYTPEENAVMYEGMKETAKKAGVKIGVENMWNWANGGPTSVKCACAHHEDFKAYMDALDKDIFVACVDIGHAELERMDTSAEQMIKTLGSYMQAMHLHDNYHGFGALAGVPCDTHQLPFTFGIDYEPMIKALKEIGYKGDITMESDRWILNMPIELIPAAARMMAEVANYFKKRIEKD
jgi:sugar phosphate isomerase/epimerase